MLSVNNEIPTQPIAGNQEPTEPSKQPIRTDSLGYVTCYQPIRDQYFLVRSVPTGKCRYLNKFERGLSPNSFVCSIVCLCSV